MIKLETKYANSINKTQLIKKYQPKINKIISNLKSKKASGIEMTGWINYCNKYKKSELDAMVKKAKEWQKAKIKDVVVIGIGGSYLGIRSGFEMLSDKPNFKVHWIFNLNNNYIFNVMKSLSNKPFGIIVISKSGTTLEPAVGFNLFRKLLSKKCKNTNQLIVAVTDKKKGTLHDLAIKNKWSIFSVPNNIGGRYSTLTPVGMFLFILSGFNYKQIIKGASEASKKYFNNNLKTNDAFVYACYRHFLKTVKHNQIENFILYDPNLQMFGETYKQLFGESEGKKHKALYPSTSLFTSDLHSMGQYLQEGTRNFFETTLFVKQPKHDLVLHVNNNEDNLKYLNGKSLSYINKVAMESTVKAHAIEGKVDNLIIYIDKQDEYHFGYLYMFLCFAAMISAYLLGLNPFDQPGVEIYKKRINKVLKK